MDKLKKIILRLIEESGFKKESIIPFVLSVGLTLAFFLDITYFDNRMLVAMWIGIGIVFSALVAWLFLKAGFTVLRSLFLLSAEISLLIFLAQAYCGVQIIASPSDNALRSLVVLGCVYIGYEFFKSLKTALRNRLDNFPEKHWSKEKMLVVGLFFIFTCSFVWAIYQVSNPVIADICVFKR